jgi:RNA polymerase sigma factor (sigma-70 family)
MSTEPAPRRGSNRPYVVAMVLGTALSALGPSLGLARDTHPEVTLRAINDMGRYCTSCWRNARLPADAWPDCTQEVLRRLLERIPAERWDQVLGGEGDERREFLRAIDAVKKRTQRARKATHTTEGLADYREQRSGELQEQREAVRQAAAQVLSPRQQRIVQMSLEGWSVQEVAQELNLSPERVSDEKYKAIRKLRDRLTS